VESQDAMATIPAGALIERAVDETGSILTDENGHRLVLSWFVRPEDRRVLRLPGRRRILRVKPDGS